MRLYMMIKGGRDIERTMKRMEVNDPLAIYNLGGWYNEGEYGYQQDRTKALELWHRAGELGSLKDYKNSQTNRMHTDTLLESHNFLKFATIFRSQFLLLSSLQLSP